MSDVVLGIETSCDETAAAVVERAQLVRSSVVSSQVERHAPFGGVVPEIAGRAHVEQMVPVIAEALVSAGAEGADLDAVAATTGPGLAGSLLIGVSAAKALSLVWDVPFVSVNHLEAHLYASFLEEPDLELPLVVLLVSGGHTMLVLMEDHCRYRLLGSTLDDAAGEAFDKVARYLGLGYPGGPAIDELAVEGDPSAFAYPRSMVQENPSTLPDDRRFAFSFSGLKTAVVNHVRNEPGAPTADVAASFQEAVVDALVTKARWAVEATGAKGMCLGGGVAANSRLRERFLDTCGDLGVRAFLPSRAMCTDNAAMVAAAGWWRLSLFGSSPLDTGADPNQGLPLVD
ncbi:MAG: tRNA (adenosine(37)-N6)-threonylcarbamoyltransferase complex transferase subunit TsaD [Acidimicrobiales bacterium]|jgi:N6-L-threonylcarbamoyladenine synthase|nr:tRNA (adenosine(37)-N6)-threonylcarbamoyltransferase complex transferase subunit TsaD [Acidimicrobiales bacterium]MDE0748535.1 tRNA (adenosine(37)-N6)-threonylcarbamoyltransferase complex transferase subunit TsaD [Acidimicrobiales bacterium]|tara:strand:- start:8581 stop:9612 length:1032 start_codon:yes stop_codon:yes gene_type:complete